MTRFVTGEEITEISGAIAETFIKQRKRPTGVSPAASRPACRAARAPAR